MASASDEIKAECDPDGDYPMTGPAATGDAVGEEAEVSGLRKETWKATVKLEVETGNGYSPEGGSAERQTPSWEPGTDAAVKEELNEADALDAAAADGQFTSSPTFPLASEQGAGQGVEAEGKAEGAFEAAPKGGQFNSSLTLPLLPEGEEEEGEAPQVIEIADDDDEDEEEEEEEEKEADDVVLLRVKKKRNPKVQIIKEEPCGEPINNVDDPLLNRNSLILRPTEEAPSEPAQHAWLASALNGVAYVTSNSEHQAVIHPVQLSAHVTPATELHDVKFSWRYLYRNVLINEETCIRWLASFQLLPNERNCPLCEAQMVVARHWTCWRCRNCKKGFSVRKDSMFNGELMVFTTIIELIYWWSLDFKLGVVCRELDLDSQTVAQWFNRLRKVCERYFQDHPRLLGGPGKEVEVTDSSFNGQWVLGIVERGTNDSYFCAVTDNSSETLLPIIERHVLPGSRIITDGWRSYVALPNHAVLNRSLHFVDPEDRSVHTNTIEGLWRHVKDELLRRKKALKRDVLDAHLREIQWRKLMGDATFGEMLYWLDFYRVRYKE